MSVEKVLGRRPMKADERPGRLADEEPTIERKNGPHYDTVERHPAYGQIGASRVTGKAHLYGSDFEHHGYIRISIHTSELARGLSHDWAHPGRELIEVSLSEAQWASFVSTLNSGQGTQCTIEHLQGQRIPGIARTTDRREQFRSEMAQTVQDAIDQLGVLIERLNGVKLPAKTRDELLGFVHKAVQELQKNVPFVAKSFDEHVERTTERAKIEVHAYLARVVTQVGLKALADAPVPPIALDEGTD